MKTRRTFPSFAVALLAASLAGSALADDLPKRKSGLWELKTRMEGMPSPGPMQICIDQANDNLMLERGKEKANCSVMDVNRSTGKVTIHAVCQHQDTTVTSDAVITGDLESGYRNDMKIHSSPPQHGMSDVHLQQEAKWLGPCKPGQRAGDMTMPGMGGGSVNMQDVMKDPRIQEMMKRQRLGQ